MERGRCRAAYLLRKRVEKVFDVDGSGPRFLFRTRQQLKHGARQIGEPGRRFVDASKPRLSFDRNVRWVGPGAPKHLLDSAIALDRACEEVNRLDLRVLALVCEDLRSGDERLGVGRVSVEVDGLLGGHRDAKLAREP